MESQGTAFYYGQARNAERIATILNETAYASEMSELASDIALAFQDNFVEVFPDGSIVIGDGSLDVACWALFLGLVPQSKKVLSRAPSLFVLNHRDWVAAVGCGQEHRSCNRCEWHPHV